MSEDKKPSGPDLTQGVLPADFNEGKLLGHVADDEVLLVQVGAEVLAINPYCSHYHGLRKGSWSKIPRPGFRLDLSPTLRAFSASWRWSEEANSTPAVRAPLRCCPKSQETGV